ncbi:MAG: hypothetical protein K8U57_28150 [Planctomycetes bacterium]|nr:hypothetical protein [Planctomycetota bacterium]
MKEPTRTSLCIEFLEAREVPAASPITETFDTSSVPGLPAGWNRWSSDNTTAFTTASGQGTGASVGLITNGGSATSALTWSGQAVSRDDGAAVTVWADSLIRTFVFTRGTNLGTQTPSYLAAVVTRGLNVQLVEVTNGSARVLGTIASPPSAYVSGQWVRVSLVPTGTSVSVQVTRADTGQYLNANGTWQAAATTAITATTTLTPATGFAGVGRAASYSGTVKLDTFTVLPGASTTGSSPVVTLPSAVKESFDTTALGAIPVGWQTWTSGNPGGFGVASAIALSPSHGFTSTGGSTTASRAWSSTTMPADVDASAAVYADGIVPARVFVRGANVNTTTPTYYAASITRGINVSLVRVVNGVETVIGSIKSVDYISSKWLRVRLVAEGSRLRVMVSRTDTDQWLTPAGTWSDTPDFALEVQDSTITAAGAVGLARMATYSGTVTFDDFQAQPASAAADPVVTVAPVSGGSTLSGEVTLRATATGSPVRVEFWLNNVLRAVSSASPATWALDTTTLANGTYTLSVRAFDALGNLGTGTYTFTTANVNATPIPTPTIPQHYSWIRIAELAYSGNPMGTFEKGLLQNSVDLVVPNPRYLSDIQATSPNTPQLIYSNVSNLYGGLLTDWLTYADRMGVSRELAFFHVSKPTAFTGNSASSQPVNWFWGMYQTQTSGNVTNVTSASRGGATNLGATGTTTAIGYTDKFREMNVTLATTAATGWSGVWEYASAVDANGKPTAWKTLTLLKDGANGMKQTGQITFDPPADWVASSVGGSDRLYYVRMRTTAGTAAQAPVVKSILGRDYVGAHGTTAGTIPSFDYTADKNGDGYLNDAEYAARKAGNDARFVYESRLFYPYYGQMRFVTDPSDSAVRRWAADYHVRLLNANPLADGIFMDNATGKVPFPGVSVLEPTSTFGADSGALMAAVSRAIAPKWVLANTAGGGTDGNYTAAGAAGAFEEFALRPLQANWSEVSDLANLVTQRLASGARYLVLDSTPAGGSATDARTQLATLAYYYLVGDAERTFLDFNGGYNPASTWTEHWSQAVTVNVGTATAAMRVFATGADPSNAALTYQVFARNYSNALVLYKPLSYATGKAEGTTASNTATTHQLGGNYRAVHADGTLGPIITSITLMNGQGAVLIKA